MATVKTKQELFDLWIRGFKPKATSYQDLFETIFSVGTSASADLAAHNITYNHGNIAHANRTALDVVSGTNTGDQTINLQGDVVGSGTSTFNATIAPNAVTLSKFQQVNTNTFLGRDTEGTGNIESLTVTAVQNMLGIGNIGFKNIRNTMIGDSALANVNSGTDNTVGGYYSLVDNVGNYNTAFGSYAGSGNINGSGNVFLGYQAGYNETGSNKLYISNSSTNFPLIKGDFTTRDLTIYGSLTVTGGVNMGVGAGYVLESRKINNKALSADVVLNSTDVSAVSNNATINSKLVTSNPVLTAADVSAVNKTFLLNNHGLSGSSLNLTAADVSALSNNTTLNGQLLSNNISLNATDVNAVASTVTINGIPLVGDVNISTASITDTRSAVAFSENYLLGTTIMNIVNDNSWPTSNGTVLTIKPSVSGAVQEFFESTSGNAGSIYHRSSTYFNDTLNYVDDFSNGVNPLFNKTTYAVSGATININNGSLNEYMPVGNASAWSYTTSAASGDFHYIFDFAVTGDFGGSLFSLTNSSAISADSNVVSGGVACNIKYDSTNLTTTFYIGSAAGVICPLNFTHTTPSTFEVYRINGIIYLVLNGLLITYGNPSTITNPSLSADNMYAKLMVSSYGTPSSTAYSIFDNFRSSSYELWSSWQTESINTTNDYNPSTDYVLFSKSPTGGLLGSAYTAASGAYFDASTGNLSCVQFTSLSDKTYKDNIQPIQNAASIIDNLQGVSFNWKDSGNKAYGVIAQDLEVVIPEAVTEGMNRKSVDYNMIIAFLIESNKELLKRIEILESK